MLKKNFILVTGGAGYIGAKVVTDLVNQNKNVIVIDDLSKGKIQLVNKKAKFFKGNFADLRLLNKLFIKHKILSVMHFAASISVPESEIFKKKYLRNNYINTKILLNFCIKTKVKNFIFSSTCAVYGDSAGKVNENTKQDPTSTYGVSKKLAEREIISQCKNNKINYCILRYFNVAGADIKNKIGIFGKTEKLINKIAKSIIRKKYKIDVYGNNHETKDGTCIRDYIYISDISKIHISCLKLIDRTSKSYIFNCGYGKGYSVLDIISKFEKKIKKKFIIRFKRKRKSDISQIIADNNKIKKFLKIKFSKNSMNKILNSSIQWEKYIAK